MQGFVPISAGSRYYEGSFGEALSDPGPLGFPNTCGCDEFLDNGMGLSWAFALGPFATVTRSFTSPFSAREQAPDQTPPDTVITGGPPASTSSTSASLAFTSSEAGSSFQCRVDSGGFAPCSSPRVAVGALNRDAHLPGARDRRRRQRRSDARNPFVDGG